MNLQDQIISDIAAKMQQEIDSDLLDTIMTESLLDDGWIETKVNPAFDPRSSHLYNNWYTETAEWCHLNATGDYKLLRGQWIFEKSEDATLFLLRWQ